MGPTPWLSFDMMNPASYTWKKIQRNFYLVRTPTPSHCYWDKRIKI